MGKDRHHVLINGYHTPAASRAYKWFPYASGLLSYEGGRATTLQMVHNSGSLIIYARSAQGAAQISQSCLNTLLQRVF